MTEQVIHEWSRYHTTGTEDFRITDRRVARTLDTVFRKQRSSIPLHAIDTVQVTSVQPLWAVIWATLLVIFSAYLIGAGIGKARPLTLDNGDAVLLGIVGVLVAVLAVYLSRWVALHIHTIGGRTLASRFPTRKGPDAHALATIITDTLAGLGRHWPESEAP